MGNRVSVEGCGRMSSLSVASRSLRLIALAALAAALTACGGGGGGGDDGGNPPPPPERGTVTATVLDDTFSTPISGATVTVTIGTTTLDETTGADGTATVNDVPVGSVTATASAPGFLTSAAQGKTVTANGTTDFDFTLERAPAEAAGGVLTVLPVGSLDPNGRTFTFTMRVVIVDENFEHVPGLGDSNFSLAACTPVTVGSSLPECVRGTQLANDHAYIVNTTPPGVLQQDPAGPPRPYAATMLLDQSGSIRGTDPTDARIFSTKVFLQGLGTSDRALLAAFAEGTEGNTIAQIPEEPVTFYPCSAAPCPSPPQFTGTGSGLFESVDSLAATEGGGTPMYDALVIAINATRDNAPTGISDQRLAVVMFSDGLDTTCGFAACVPIRQGVIDLAQPDDPNIRDVDLFTIGLSSGVDSASLAELAIKGNGTYLFAENANQLIPIYGSLGALLSDSLPTYEMTWTVDAQADNVFLNGRSVIGRLTVDTGSAEPFELRFIAPIFEL